MVFIQSLLRPADLIRHQLPYEDTASLYKIAVPYHINSFWLIHLEAGWCILALCPLISTYDLFWEFPTQSIFDTILDHYFSCLAWAHILGLVCLSLFCIIGCSTLLS
jgi:hypothetical protein